MKAKKHPGGRPTKLTPAMVKAAREFLDERIADRKLLPTVEGLALHLHVHKDTLYEWAKEPGEFSDILSDLKNAQAEKLMQKSLSSEYNATIAKLILSGKHGYVEKQEQDITSGGNAIAPVLVKFVGEGDGDQSDHRDTD